MNDHELDELIANHPTLFHMAEQGSWQNIRERGLLSTTALLDIYGYHGDQRANIEERNRPDKIPIQSPELPDAVIRDQKPMTDAGLARSLRDGLEPRDWHITLNQKVFFWLSRDRLHTMLKAKAYRDDPHDVLEVDTHSLVQAYRDAIWLSPMNTGCTKPYPHPRGQSTFRRILEYDYKARPKKERAVELSIDYSVPNIANFVQRVVEMQREAEIRVLYNA